MSTMAHSYRSIDDKPSTIGDGFGMAKHGAPMPGTMSTGGYFLSRGTAVPSLGRNAVSQVFSAPTPEVNFYTEPLNPSSQLTLRDRVQLVLESCRPWTEFFDLKAFNAPAPMETKLRIGHNLEIFFYNYVVIGFALLALSALFHPIQSFVLAFVVLSGAVMYIILPEDYRVTDSFFITRSLKHFIMAILTIMAVLMGHVLSLFIFFSSVFLPVIILHAFFREHAVTGIPTV